MCIGCYYHRHAEVQWPQNGVLYCFSTPVLQAIAVPFPFQLIFLKKIPMMLLKLLQLMFEDEHFEFYMANTIDECERYSEWNVSVQL